MNVLQVVNMGLLACAVAPQLIRVSDTRLETKDKHGAAANCGCTSFVVFICFFLKGKADAP